MARPNPEQGLRLLVCSTNEEKVRNVYNILRVRNGEPEVSSQSAVAFQYMNYKGPVTFEDKGFEMTIVSKGDEIKGLMEKQKPPYYSAVLYDSHVIEKDGPNIIAAVRSRDYFIPQVIIGRLSTERTSQSAKAGSIYFADTERLADHIFSNIFLKSKKLPRLTVVKAGGSTFDYDRQTDGMNIKTLCQILSRMYEEKSDKIRHENRVLLTVGAGQFGDVIKHSKRKFSPAPKVDKAYPEMMAKALQFNLELLNTYFDGDNVSLLTSGAFYHIEGKLNQKIPLIGMAPHYILARDGIPLEDSDTHTIALAEFYGAERVVLVKRTDGIYDHDPYLGFVLDPATGKCRSVEEWKTAQQGNKRHGVLSVDELLEGNVSREGTDFNLGKYDGSQGHLMEDSAIRYFRYCKHVNEILVVHIAPEEMHCKVGENEYQHVITGETIQLGPGGWNGILEERVRDAFQGKAPSKIVRE